jgi:hypothetical protein
MGHLLMESGAVSDAFRGSACQAAARCGMVLAGPAASWPQEAPMATTGELKAKEAIAAAAAKVDRSLRAGALAMGAKVEITSAAASLQHPLRACLRAHHPETQREGREEPRSDFQHTGS